MFDVPRSWSVIRELVPIGKYRIRVIRDYKNPLEPFMDIREYVSTEQFEGFTRRGIRLDTKQVLLLAEIIREAVPVEHGPVKVEYHERNEELHPGSSGVFPAVGEAPRKEVSVKHCTLCQKEIPALGPESGIGYKEETLCGVCLKAAQRVCPHALKKEDGVTCRDCGARPWTAKRVALGAAGLTKAAVVGFVKLFMMYTLPSIIGTAVVGGVFYMIGKKMGLF